MAARAFRDPVPPRRPGSAGAAIDRARSQRAEAARRELHASILDHVPALRGYARTLCREGEGADDLVQETLLRGIAAAGSFAPGTNLRAWLLTILRNAFINEARRARIARPALAHMASRTRSIEPAQLHAIELRELGPMLDELPPQMGRTLLLVRLYGLTYREAAAHMAVPTGTVRSRLNRATDALLSRSA